MIELTDDMRQRLSTALVDGYPVVTSTVDAQGQPHLSFYGTTQVLNGEQLALWVRNPAAGFLARIAVNPRVALLYRHGPDRVSYQFHGRATTTDDDAIRAHVFVHSPEVERNLDPDRLGVAVVIDVDLVRGRANGQPLEMSR